MSKLTVRKIETAKGPAKLVEAEFGACHYPLRINPHPVAGRG